jgi:TRAP-type C4-dicarboxylate transport system substrate-binding protein
MPATAVDSARYAANIYAALIISERRLLAMLSARPRDRAVIEDALAETRDVARQQYQRYRSRILDLFAAGQGVQACRIVLDVQERTRAARTPVEITVSED